MSGQDVQGWIKDQVTGNDVVLFMKGTKEFPQCGFSGRVAQILAYLGVSYKDINVLADDSVREGIKVYTNWPTVPQLYVKGEFVGGSDIVTEMFQSGELQKLLTEKGVPGGQHTSGGLRGDKFGRVILPALTRQSVRAFAIFVLTLAAAACLVLGLT